MKTIKFSLLAIAAAFAISTFSGCSKGDTGATGPQGPAGQNGNANVQVGVYTVVPSAWISDGNGGWYTNLTPTTDPTQGGVSILFSFDDVDWFGLPYVGHVVGDPDINYIATSANLQISYAPQTTYLSIAQPTSNAYIQVSLIPMAIVIKHPNTNWKNPMEVAKLPEVQQALNSSN